MDIQVPQILFQIINFGVVTGVLTYLLFKPIRKMLQERTERVEQAQKAAESTLAEKKNLDEMKKKAVVDAQKQAAKIVEEAKKDAKILEKGIVDEAKKSVAQEQEKMVKQLKDEKIELSKQMRAQFISEVAAMTEKVIGQSVDQKTLAKQLDADIDAVLARI